LLENITGAPVDWKELLKMLKQVIVFGSVSVVRHH